MIVEVSAPANIAFIKYMGKTSAENNFPTNGSLSLTLEHLRTFVRIQLDPTLSEDVWEPLVAKGIEKISLSEKGKQRFLKHFIFLKKTWELDGCFRVASGNNFPSDCGLASSASSFAALTLGVAEILNKRRGKQVLQLAQLAQYSRLGSGSSCRSFFPNLVMWKGEKIQSVASNFGPLYHQVVIVEDSQKSVSSSEAHQRVLTSGLFIGRPERAETRLQEFLEAAQAADWKRLFSLTWADFWDMHALFETSEPCFGYMNPASLEILETARRFWNQHHDGPIVTMDAGANVHFIYRQDQIRLARDLVEILPQRVRIISSPELTRSL